MSSDSASETAAWTPTEREPDWFSDESWLVGSSGWEQCNAIGTIGDTPSGPGWVKIVGVAQISDTRGEPEFRVYAAWVPHEGFGDADLMELRVRRIDGRPLTASAVRQLPLGTVLEDLRKEAVTYLVNIHFEWNAPAPTVGSLRGRSIPQDTLQAVADVYTRARRDGQPVTSAVADAFQISQSTAGKRIMRAREAGYLPKAGGR